MSIPENAPYILSTLYIATLLNDVALLWSAILSNSLLAWLFNNISWFFDKFGGPLFGSLTGVIIGFYINRRHQNKKDYESKLSLLGLLRSEIRNAIGELKKLNPRLIKGQFVSGRLPSQLPTDVWVSIINSGSLKFFKTIEATKLASIYNEIQKYNKMLEETNREVEYYKSLTDPTKNSDYLRILRKIDAISDDESEKDMREALESELHSIETNSDVRYGIAYGSPFNPGLRLRYHLESLEREEWFREGEIESTNTPEDDHI